MHIINIMKNKGRRVAGIFSRNKSSLANLEMAGLNEWKIGLWKLCHVYLSLVIIKCFKSQRSSWRKLVWDKVLRVGVENAQVCCVACPGAKSGTGSPSNLLMIFLHSLTLWVPWVLGFHLRVHARPAAYAVCLVFYLSTNYILNYVCFSPSCSSQRNHD